MLITDVIDSHLQCYGNNTSNILLMVQYDSTIDSTLDTYSSDLLIINELGFKSGDIIEVKKDSVSLGNFTISSDTSAIWLSELIGEPRETIDYKSGLSENYEFIFLNSQMLRFQLITQETSLFTANAQDVFENGLESSMYLLAETQLNMADESSVGAIRHAIDNTEVTVEMESNKVTMNASYPTFGSQLPDSFLVDYLISFEKTIPLGTEANIKKDGVQFKTVKFKKNTNHIWFSDLIEENREFLKSKISEQYEFNFVFDHTANVQVFTGEVSAFLDADTVMYDIPFGLFKLADSQSLNIDPTPLKSRFVVVYEDYSRTIKSAKVDINGSQYVSIDFVENNELDETYCRIHNHDDVFNVGIDLILNKEGIRNYIELLRDVGRQLR